MTPTTPTKCNPDVLSMIMVDANDIYPADVPDLPANSVYYCVVRY